MAGRLQGADGSEPAVTCGGADNLFLMYTSGTTGHPKGVVHTHDSVHTAANAWSLTIHVRYKDRLLLPLPVMAYGSRELYFRTFPPHTDATA